MLFSTWTDDEGNVTDLEGESVEAIAQQLPEGETVDLKVYDEPGFLRGWIHGRNDWRAQ